jgi:predicted amidohydrolase
MVYLVTMRIGVAQTKPVKGAIDANIINHKKLIAVAVEQRVDILVFPELSITGYEPELAKELVTTEDDPRFDDFQLISNGSRITLAIGAPVQGEAGVMIGMVIFQPNKPRQVYAKQYLHADELPFFVCGQEQVFLGEDKDRIALAICYEVSVPEHAVHAYEHGAAIYLASVAKTRAGIEKTLPVLAETAGKYGMAVAMSNCIGSCDDAVCGGKTSVWNKEGKLLAQLNDINEGILILDADTDEVIEKIL